MNDTSDNSTMGRIYYPLWLTYSLVPLLAGIDKFTNLLVDWERYLAPIAADLLPVSPGAFMILVGVIEIAVGMAALTIFTRLAAYVATVWLVMIAINLVAGGYYDIAVRDLAMAVGAYSLGEIAALRGQPLLPGRASEQRERHHVTTA